MRRQYHFRPSPNGFFAWDVHRLIELSKDLPVFEHPLSAIAEIDEPYWFYTGDAPTCRAIAEHAHLIDETDLAYPIILCAAGRVMDGMHRVCKALTNRNETISAVRFEHDPDPDFTDVLPKDLSYGDPHYPLGSE